MLTSLTPCVYPLIPITVGVFGARQADSRGRAFLLTTSYVVGMGLVFASLGVFAALSGKAFGSLLGNGWVLLFLAGFMVLLAASMFGAFELALPTGLATKLNGVGGGGVIGAMLMGSVAGFLAAPCTGPVLSSVLAWVAQTKDPFIGGALLFIYALGIGVPFFLIGVFTVRLPKGGAWMEAVKSVFGVALLGLAVYYLRLRFPSLGSAVAGLTESMGLAGTIGVTAVLAFIGVVAGAIHFSFKEAGEWLRKGAGVAVLLVAFVLRTSAPEAAPVGGPERGGEFVWALEYNTQVAKSAEPFEAVLAKAKAECRPVMVDFFADWCAACKELDQFTYVAPEVQKEAERFVTVKVDGTVEDDVLEGLYRKFNVQGLPTVAFIDASGELMQAPRVLGFMQPSKFVNEMRRVAACTKVQ